MIERIISQLDADQPRWYVEWATPNELLAYSEDVNSIVIKPTMPEAMCHELSAARRLLKQAVAMRLLPRLTNVLKSLEMLK